MTRGADDDRDARGTAHVQRTQAEFGTGEIDDHLRAREIGRQIVEHADAERRHAGNFPRVASCRLTTGRSNGGDHGDGLVGDGGAHDRRAHASGGADQKDSGCNSGRCSRHISSWSRS
jgi:hypothetical protein